MIKIEKNVPVPKWGVSEYPILEMGVGDSFFVPCKETERAKVRTRIWSKINGLMRAEKITRKHTVRSVEGGFRAWRLK